MNTPAAKAPIPAAIYGRVSTEKQDISTQDAKCAAYCQLQDMAATTFLDEDTSGAIPFWDRPSGKQVIAAIERGEFRHIVVAKLDRLGRNARDFHNLLHWLDQRQVTLHIIDLGGTICTTAGSGKILLGILALVAEFERDMTRARIQDKMDAKFKRGEALGGTAPYGWDITQLGKVKRLTDNPTEQAWIRRMAEWKSAGWTYHQIMTRLNQLCVRTKQCGPWTWNGVRRVLAGKHTQRLLSQAPGNHTSTEASP